MSYGYNSAGQKTAIASPSGTTSLGYDTLGRLHTVADKPTGATVPTTIAGFSYDAVGNLAGLSRSNGVSTTYTYNDLNQLTQLSHRRGTATLASYTYTPRADGKRTGVSEALRNADGRISERELSYVYDASGRLTRESGQDGLGVNYQNEWSYDAVGNREVTTSRKATSAANPAWANVTTVSAAFNANDWLLSESSVVNGGPAQVRTYSYDSNGAEKTITSGARSRAVRARRKIPSATPDSSSMAMDAIICARASTIRAMGASGVMTRCWGKSKIRRRYIVTLMPNLMASTLATRAD